MRASLRGKVALAFSLATIVLLAAQALGVKAIAESQEKQLIDSLIAGDMREQMKFYRADATYIPPLDPRLNARVSQEGGLKVTLPVSLKGLPNGQHEVMIDGRVVHIAVDEFQDQRIYRIFDYSAFESHFQSVINALMIGTSAIALLTIWLAFWLSGLLVKQIAGLAEQVKKLRSGEISAIRTGRYDEIEVAELVETFNDYHTRMATMVEREKDFTSNVSHELRTPLTTIKTSCELLEQDVAITGKSQIRLQQTKRAASHMQLLIESLLVLARGGDAANSTQLRLAETLDEVVVNFADVLARKHVQSIVEVDRNIRVVANGAALAIVLSNLIDNAIRHTELGSIRFTYRAGSLVIEDSGCGIPTESLPHVFERFFQAQVDPINVHGIGLAIVKKICDQNGWSIHLHSEPGSGTRATLGLREIVSDYCTASSSSFDWR